MNKQFFAFLAVVLLFFCLVCNRSPSQPEEKINNPRNYTWTVDTLAYPGSFQTLMSSIWGSSAKDVYVVGHNDGGSGKMYHYTGDGMWHHINLPKIGHWYDLNAIYGFAENDVWAAGYSRELITRDSTGRGVYENLSLIFHYDGVQWSEVDLPEGGNMLQSLWGSAPDDIWAGGINGTLFHYNGSFWEKDSVPYPIPKDASPWFNFFTISGNEQEVYVVLLAPYPNLVTDRYFLFKKDHHGWTVLDSFYYDVRNIWVSPENELYLSGYGIKKYSENSWTSFYPTGLIQKINGTNADNLFAVGSEGGISKILHYNGSDWYTYETGQFPYVLYTGIWTDGIEAFICGWLSDTPENTIILHGK